MERARPQGCVTGVQRRLAARQERMCWPVDSPPRRGMTGCLLSAGHGDLGMGAMHAVQI
ncbi:hypothetical protein [Ornithinimicrobium kibberense]|uniref:hypothetical protein n=1 Tax=Ornithinimicrobium kibberense TaxID=282060 RepID=UPI00361536FF